MTRDDLIETETHHNQGLTQAALNKRSVRRQSDVKKKVVALQLDERQHAALNYLGGPAALKQLLAPDQQCIRCRMEPVTTDSWYCAACGDTQGEAT